MCHVISFCGKKKRNTNEVLTLALVLTKWGILFYSLIFACLYFLIYNNVHALFFVLVRDNFFR